MTTATKNVWKHLKNEQQVGEKWKAGGGKIEDWVWSVILYGCGSVAEKCA